MAQASLGEDGEGLAPGSSNEVVLVGDSDADSDVEFISYRPAPQAVTVLHDSDSSEF